MIKTTDKQLKKHIDLIDKAIKSEIYGNGAIWNFLIAYILSNPSSQKKYFPLFCDDSIPITSDYDIWLESQPLPPRKGVGKNSEGKTKLDIAFGSIKRRYNSGKPTGTGIKYDPDNTDAWICFVEGKFKDRLSTKIVHDPNKNQLTRVVENALCFQGDDQFPKKLYVVLLTPQAYKNDLEKFKEYKEKPENIIKDIESSQIQRRPPQEDWKYPDNIEERIKMLTLNWITYEDIIGREYNMSDLYLTNLNDKQKEFFSDKFDKLVTYCKSNLIQP